VSQSDSPDKDTFSSKKCALCVRQPALFVMMGVGRGVWLAREQKRFVFSGKNTYVRILYDT
jgi:hypothetical protein